MTFKAAKDGRDKGPHIALGANDQGATAEIQRFCERTLVLAALIASRADSERQQWPVKQTFDVTEAPY